MINKLLPGLIIISLFFLISFSETVYADDSAVGIGTTAVGGTTPGTWVVDDEVTITGKFAIRSADFLKNTLNDYKWFHMRGDTSPLTGIWIVVRNISYAVLSLFILAAAFFLIITRGRDIKVSQFVPKFLFAVILIFLSFALVQFIYQVVDAIQGLFIIRNGKVISSEDLLNIYFNYKDFLGYKRTGGEFAESSFISLLLIKVTAFTYFSMSGVLIIRKILLWFFIIISPIFGLLIIFNSLRGVVKVWLGEFFRWVLYAPLFAILLSGLVSVWKIGIPLSLDLPCADAVKIADESKNIYPTGINILLGGPCEQVALTNNLNTPDTFLEYVVAIFMLWMVIILPFILLHMILEYIKNNSSKESEVIKYLVGHGSSFIDRYRNPSDKPREPTPDYPTGAAKSLPILSYSEVLRNKSEEKDKAFTSLADSYAQAAGSTYTKNSSSVSSEASSLISQKVDQAIGRNMQNNSTVSGSLGLKTASSPVALSAAQTQRNNNDLGVNLVNLTQATSDLLTLTNLAIPAMKDIVRYETIILNNQVSVESVNTQSTNDINVLAESLRRIAGTSPIISGKEKEHYSSIKERLIKESQHGNPVASSILSASNSTRGFAVLPEVNKVQTVNLEDYEEVKKIWKENYSQIEPPEDEKGNKKDKKTWLKEEIEKIKEVINLLLSDDPEEQKKGQEMVSKILPFLLLGGFSKAEIISYLKAKIEAAKEVSEEEFSERQKEKVVVENNKQQQAQVMHQEMEESGK